MSDERRLVVVLEGLDGSGKTSCAKLLLEQLQSSRIEARLYPALKSTPEGREASDWLVRNKGASAAEVFAVILPALVSVQEAVMDWFSKVPPVTPAVAVLDRWWFSGYAYQGAGGMASADIMRGVRDHLTLPLYAMLSFYLYVPLDVRLSRTAERGGVDLTHLDSVSMRNNEELERRYGRLAAEKWLRTVDATQPLSWVVDSIYSFVWAALNNPTGPASTDIRASVDRWLKVLDI